MLQSKLELLMLKETPTPTAILCYWSIQAQVKPFPCFCTITCLIMKVGGKHSGITFGLLTHRMELGICALLFQFLPSPDSCLSLEMLLELRKSLMKRLMNDYVFVR